MVGGGGGGGLLLEEGLSLSDIYGRGAFSRSPLYPCVRKRNSYRKLMQLLKTFLSHTHQVYVKV